MDQALSVEHLTKNHGSLKNQVYPVPLEIDQEVARLKLKSMNSEIDVLTEAQVAYLNSWSEGT